MKTIIKSTLALVLFTVTLSANAITPPSSLPTLPEEAYIDDVPFDTEAIFDSLCDASMVECFKLTEETYINDVPFNTEEVVQENMVFNLPDEEYIDDVKIETKMVAFQ